MSAQQKTSKKAPAKTSKGQSVAGKGKAVPLATEERGAKPADSNQENGNSDNGKGSTMSGVGQPDTPDGSKTSDSPGGEDDERNSSAADHHSRVAELATQLACAQLNAEASRESARLTVSGIQRLAAAYLMASAKLKTDLETLGSKPELIDAAFVYRACADLLSAAEVQELPLHKASPLNHPDHDALFEGAVIRAQRLLRSPSEDTSEIHAEQLFDADEILSEAQVGERFKGCGWPGLSNRDDFYQFVVRVERWFHAHRGRIYSPEEDVRFADDAKMMGYVLELGKRRQENDLFRQIYELVRDNKLPNHSRERWTSAEELSHASWTQHLIDVIFCGRRPSQDRENERRTIRSYRPWGLFRFLRILGAEDPDGCALLEQLSTTRNQIACDALVYPLNQSFPRITDFGPLNRLVDERERQESPDERLFQFAVPAPPESI